MEYTDPIQPNTGLASKGDLIMAKIIIGFTCFLSWGALQMVDNLMTIAGAK